MGTEAVSIFLLQRQFVSSLLFFIFFMTILIPD